ncbi:MAG: sigma-70 family RNA polymerase sigma factor [Pseudomonadota bacterium]
MTHDLQQILIDNAASLERIARRYAGPNDWQDLLQEITVNLWRGLDRFEGRSALSTWVYRVAVNTALSHVRKKPLPVLAGSGELAEKRPTAIHPGDQLAVLEQFLESLDPVNRAVLLLDLEGLHRDEVADVLGLSPGAVAVRMTRLKERFTREFLEAA